MVANACFQCQRRYKNVDTLFISGLFNKPASSSDYVASYDGRIMNNEVKTLSKEEVVAYFKTLSRHLPGGTYKNN
jgi:hypothetical protein